MMGLIVGLDGADGLVIDNTIMTEKEITVGFFGFFL